MVWTEFNLKGESSHAWFCTNPVPILCDYNETLLCAVLENDPGKHLYERFIFLKNYSSFQPVVIFKNSAQLLLDITAACWLGSEKVAAHEVITLHSPPVSVIMFILTMHCSAGLTFCGPRFVSLSPAVKEVERGCSEYTITFLIWLHVFIYLFWQQRCIHFSFLNIYLQFNFQ